MSPQPIKLFAVAKNIRCRTLAAATGVSEAQVSRVLNGQQRGSIALRRQLAAIIGEPIESLFS